MRKVVWLVVVAPWLAGCATGTSATKEAARRQWKVLCSRMPHRADSGGRAVLVAQPRDPGSVTLPRVAARAAESIVHVRTRGLDRTVRGGSEVSVQETGGLAGGTGVVVHEQGLILTSDHVVPEEGPIVVVLSSGAEHAVERIIRHPRYDIALLRIAATGLKPLTPSRQAPRAGMEVLAMRYAARPAGPTFMTGTVTEVRKSLQRELDPAGRKDYGGLLESTAAVTPGFSGGPLLDAEGRLIGITVAAAGGSSAARRRGYAIPSAPCIADAVHVLCARMQAAD